MQYASNYSLVLFGPVPHSAKGKGDSESIIAEIEKQNGYPPVIRLEAGNELKITKNNFKKALCEALTRGIICKDYFWRIKKQQPKQKSNKNVRESYLLFRRYMVQYKMYYYK